MPTGCEVQCSKGRSLNAIRAVSYPLVLRTREKAPAVACAPIRGAASAGFIAFLTETDSQTEFAVTYSKQTPGKFLTETRIGCQVITSETENAKDCADKSAQAVVAPTHLVYRGDEIPVLPFRPGAQNANVMFGTSHTRCRAEGPGATFKPRARLMSIA